MSTKIAKFQFYTSAYFGEAGIGVEESSEMVHSDTIFSAICHAWGIVYGKTDMESMLAKFKDAAPFLITSCFLYSNETFFLPKPHTLPPGFENAEIREEFGKKVKNISFLPFELFEQWAKREKIENYLKKVVLPDYDSCYQFDLIPRATIDRSTLNAQIFRMKTVRFNKDCGLYCIVKINDLSIEEKIKSSLEYLGESGLGGKRNIGLGRYKLCWEDINEKWKNLLAFKGNAHCTLSLYHMNIEGVLESLIEGASYGLIERRGWMSTPFSKAQYKRKTVSMFSEGSVFKQTIQGNLVSVTPEILEKKDFHPVYRNGLAFTVPILA